MSLTSIPNGPHWAIIQSHSRHVPGDERSRTAPGHGYPAHTETYITYQAFTTQSEWEGVVESMTLRGESFRAIRAHVATVSVKVETKT